jgi:hypothetical protein
MRDDPIAPEVGMLNRFVSVWFCFAVLAIPGRSLADECKTDRQAVEVRLNQFSGEQILKGTPCYMPILPDDDKRLCLEATGREVEFRILVTNECTVDVHAAVSLHKRPFDFFRSGDLKFKAGSTCEAVGQTVKEGKLSPGEKLEVVCTTLDYQSAGNQKGKRYKVKYNVHGTVTVDSKTGREDFDPEIVLEKAGH